MASKGEVKVTGNSDKWSQGENGNHDHAPRQIGISDEQIALRERALDSRQAVVEGNINAFDGVAQFLFNLGAHLRSGFRLPQVITPVLEVAFALQFLDDDVVEFLKQWTQSEGKQEQNREAAGADLSDALGERCPAAQSDPELQEDEHTGNDDG